MFTGTLDPVSRSAYWIDSFGITDEDTGDDIDLSAATEIVVIIRDPETRCEIKRASLSGGTISIVELGVFQWTFTDTDMETLCFKTYDVLCRITTDGIVTQLIIGSLPVLDG